MKQHFSFVIVAVLVTAIQLTVTALGQSFYLTQLTMAAYYTVVAVGLCMLMAYAGQISLGHAGFFAIGGYISAALSTSDFSGFAKGSLGQLFVRFGAISHCQDTYGTSITLLNPWLACIVAVVAAALIAVAIGLPTLRLRGHYLAMATLGFGSIVYKVALGTKTFGGADGLSGVPALPIAPGVCLSGSISHRSQNYYIAWLMVFVSVFLMRNLLNSRPGRALRAIHGNEEAARSVGVDVARYKLSLFVISAVFASVAGVFLTHFNGGIGPSEASIMKSIRYVAIVAVGGMANLWGTVAASVILNFLSLRGCFGSYDEAVFGGILVIVMLFAPNGMLVKPDWLLFPRLFKKRAVGKDELNS